ncbi:hypothetical protein HY967_04135, partial [Candidatus Jorgensenbacteria bacterium]|nr:hypothetical protein [Candidatus Jorgensenbacteria bacterium]
MNEKDRALFTAVSGLKWPTQSRDYLVKMFRDAAVSDRARFIILAGHIVDGKFLEQEYKDRLQSEIDILKTELAVELEDRGAENAQTVERLEAQVSRGTFDRASLKAKKQQLKDSVVELKNEAKSKMQELSDSFRKRFVDEMSKGLDGFLPVIPEMRYHIVIAEDVYDKPIGVEILEALQNRRRRNGTNDIVLHGERRDGFYDTEVKIPVRMEGVDEIRVIVPRRQPWFYRIITSFMQRLINSFTPRTFSKEPDLILVGCTGTAAHLPYYEGVPSIAVPALHKIDEVLSTENMVGCVSVRATHCGRNGKVTFVPKFHDFRRTVLHEKEFA